MTWLIFPRDRIEVVVWSSYEYAEGDQVQVHQTIAGKRSLEEGDVKLNSYLVG